MDEMIFNKSSRILYIYTELLCGHTVNKRELAFRFHVNEKSIQRDLEVIREFLDRKIGEEGYGPQLNYDFSEKSYYLEQDRKFIWSNEEVLAVSKILLESRAFTKKEMMGILDKLVEKCVPEGERRVINDLLSNERYHYVELHHQGTFMDKLLPLGHAIRECRMIQIKYGKLRNRTVVIRKLKPLAILFSEYYFYLAGFIENIDKENAFENADDSFPTIYRIDRIQELALLNDHFKIPYADRFEDGIYTIVAEVFGKGIDMWIRSQGDRIKQIL